MSTFAQKLLLSAAIAASGMAFAEQSTTEVVEAPYGMAGGTQFYKSKAEGWFWYKDPPKEVKKKVEKKKELSSSSSSCREARRGQN